LKKNRGLLLTDFSLLIFMNKQNRLEELLSYKILDTPPEKTLNDFTEIAAAICDTPIALISILDDKRQWFKAKIGLKVKETPIEDSFCQYALDEPEEVMIVNDSQTDHRFINNPLVTGDPHIRFYAGAPLVTPKGNVLGTICTIDKKPKKITDKQKKALSLLSRKVMDHFNTTRDINKNQKIVARNAERLKHIIDHAPGAIFQFEMDRAENMSILFISQGIFKLYPTLDTATEEVTAQMIFNAIHPEDLPNVQQSIQSSFKHLHKWVVEYRVMMKDHSVAWHKVKANPHRKKNGSVEWYGTVQNVTSRKEYEDAMEKMAFDISHILRRPVSTLMGLANIIETDRKIDEEKLKNYVRFIKVVSEEMNVFTKQLNSTYEIKRRSFDTHTF
jgi:PAS domain S-box-containing protein